ncbi:GNAT family N-acetyltransferase [Humitalea sp. 24SJ18S-53]|uniref:bifunctional acetate--CoA ligase family protein/GNAT family N-acetyltransferase n=1 Tax=Humitalea sp. 24SJ18S-53 TaxID=3422307 RepID=UPI003D66FBA3
MSLPVTHGPRKKGFADTALFRPRAVVLLADPSLPEAGVLAANLAAGGFAGALSILGMDAPGLTRLPDLGALEMGTDLAVIALPRESVGPAMAGLAARGCHAAVVVTDMPAPELAAAGRATGVRALGPRSFGLCVPAIGLNASLSHLPVPAGRLAVACQGSALPRALIDWALGQAVGFSHIIGIGDNADIGFAPALDWIARDPSAGAVLLDLRRIRNRRMFISAARAAARTRPVVAIRPGARSTDGNGDAVLEAALRRAGVLRVDGLEDLLAAAETLPRVRPASRHGADALPGDRIAIVANGEGLALLGADAVADRGARLAVTGAANPLTLPATSGVGLVTEARRLATLPAVDCVILLHAPTPGEDEAPLIAALTGTRPARGQAPLLTGWCGQHTAGAQRRALAEAGMAVFPTPEGAVRGAMHLARDHQARAAAAETPSRDVLDLAPDRDAVGALIARARAEGRHDMNEADSLAVLAAYGLPCIPSRAAKGPTQAAVAAAALGFPAVLKILSSDLPRKTDVGGVVLGLRDSAAVLRAAKAMLADVAARRPQARLDGVLVQRMAEAGQELRLHLSDDPMFGPYIGFGRGGTAADFEPDEGFDLPPLNNTLATALVDRSRAARLFAGYRDLPPVDRQAVADALVRLSQIAVDFPEIAAISINPLRAGPAGVMALDASVSLRVEGSLGHLAIPPYPAELSRAWTARDGEEVTIRPIRPEDAAAHAEAFARLKAEDVRWRFFTPLKELPPEQIARMTQVDYDREMAFVAVDAAARTVGVSRLIRTPDGDAEFAVVVDPDWKGRGLGRALMQRIIDWGRSVGVRRIVGQVLADNAPMLGFVRALGFVARRLPDEEEVLEAVLDLSPAPAG